MSALKRFRRLTQMGLPEIRFRVSQELRIARERVQLATGRAPCGLPDWRSVWNESAVCNESFRQALQEGSAAAEKALPDYLLSCGRPAFFLSGGDTGTTRCYREVFPGRAEHILSEASRLSEHGMKLFGYPEVACGPHIAWRKDLIHGRESGLDHWSRIRYLDFASVGDNKIVWEPNRHQHLVTLAIAFRLTGDNRFAEEAFAQFEHWQAQNPYLRGINWSSSLELAFRAWSWIWMIYLLAGSPAATGRRLGTVIQALGLHAEFIAAYLSTYFSPNTHLLGEGFALFAIGLLFPELRSAADFREIGRVILNEEMTSQVHPDGSHAEQSTCYQRYATEFFLAATILADRNGCRFSEAYRARLERMVEFILDTAWPNGKHSMTGDADGGRLLPFGVNAPDDLGGILSTAAVYFGREDFRHRAHRFHEQTYWLLGPAAVSRFQELIPNAPDHTSSIRAAAGIVVMRSNWSPEANMLIFDAGPQGTGPCGHGHADALGVVCSGKGANWLIDPGTFTYSSSPKWRDFFRSSRAHNTLEVDGQGQADPGDIFKWHNCCHARLDRAIALPQCDYAAGSHAGYRRLAQPVEHRRRIVFIKPDYWFLLDDVTGAGTHLLEFLFHFAPEADLRVDRNRCWATKGEQHFLLLAAPGTALETVIGRQDPPQGWFSHNYGHREPAPVLASTVRCQTPACFPWLLWPGAPGDVRVRQLSEGFPAWCLETENQVDIFAFSNERSRHITGTLETDAEFAFLRQNLDGCLERLTIVRGSLLAHNGALLCRSNAKVDELEIIRAGDRLEVCMRPVQPFTFAAAGVSSVLLNSHRVAFTNVGQGVAVNPGI